MRCILTIKDDLDNHFKISYSPVLTGYFAAVVPKNNPLAKKKDIYPNELKGQNIILLDNNWCPPEQLHLQEIIRKDNDNKHISYVNNVSNANIMAESGLGIETVKFFV